MLERWVQDNLEWWALHSSQLIRDTVITKEIKARARRLIRLMTRLFFRIIKCEIIETLVLISVYYDRRVIRDFIAICSSLRSDTEITIKWFVKQEQQHTARHKIILCICVYIRMLYTHVHIYVCIYCANVLCAGVAWCRCAYTCWCNVDDYFAYVRVVYVSFSVFVKWEYNIRSDIGSEKSDISTM